MFALVVRQTTFRILSTIAGQLKMTIRHFDTKTAFLNGKLTEEIQMKQPERYLVPGKEDMVCRLTKSIHGLKQAARVWNQQLDKILRRYNFKRSLADPCLYIITSIIFI